MPYNSDVGWKIVRWCYPFTAVFLVLFLAGCMVAQVPSRKSVLGNEDIAFIERGKTTRSEVRKRLREGEDYPDIHITCYPQRIVSYKMVLFVLIFPVDSRPGQAPDYDVVFIQFDEQELVRRVVKERAIDKQQWRQRAEEIAHSQNSP